MIQCNPPASPLDRVLVVTGAGISAESGIPTFRGRDGYWRNFDPTKLATEAAFRNDPALVWQWYRERRDLIRRSQPNAAHQALVRLAGHTREFLLLTQNVDDLHARAEWRGRRLGGDQIVPIHGDIFITKCTRCAFSRRDTAADSPEVPRCPHCGGMMRPGVVWFGEELNPREVERMERFLSRNPCEVVLVIGTTAVFSYIVHWALAAKGAAGRLIEINPEETAVSPHATETIRHPAAKCLPELVGRLIR
jgi:NAD-dependent deacetylase